MTQERNISGRAVAERLRASSLVVNDNNPVEAMLANSLREGKPLADDGSLYDTVQAAENAASGFVFVPPGTFFGTVNISTTGLTLLGAGRASHIHGGDNDAILAGTDTTIQNLSVSVNSGSGNVVDCISGGGGVTVENCWIRESPRHGIDTRDNYTITNCVFESVQNDGVLLRNNGKVVGNIFQTGVSNLAVDTIGGDGEMIIANNIINGPGGIGIRAASDDSIVIGNRVIDSGDDGIAITGADNIIANNNITGSTNSAGDNSGTGTLFDGNYPNLTVNLYDNFESGDLSAWTGLTDAGGGQEISTTSFNGTYGARVYVDTTGSGSRLHSSNLTIDLSAHDEIRLRCYARHDDNSGPYIAVSPDSTGFNWVGVHHRFANNDLRVEDRQQSEFSTVSVSLSTGTWYEYEAIIDLVNDEVTATVYDTSGTQLGTTTLASSGDLSTYGTWPIALITGTKSGNTHNSYFDDVRYELS